MFSSFFSIFFFTNSFSKIPIDLVERRRIRRTQRRMKRSVRMKKNENKRTRRRRTKSSSLFQCLLIFWLLLLCRRRNYQSIISGESVRSPCDVTANKIIVNWMKSDYKTRGGRYQGSSRDRLVP